MKKYLLFGLSLFLAWTITAQERTVTGTIKDAETGDPVPGANVVEKGTTNGTITDFNGQYKLSVTEGASLIISFVGYKTTEVEVGSRSIVDVGFELDVTSLAEVVVIGYGQVEKADATGAVVAVSAKDFNGGIISSPEQLIQGKTAGVQITSASGNPGSGVSIRIRGAGSIRSNNNPLFVVDGVPLAGGTQPAASDVGMGTTGDTNPLNFINPSDIKSISILKDASATAVYGSRGANGVVIITTKSGEGNRGTIEFSSSASISSPAKQYDLLSAEDYLDAYEDFGGNRASQDAGDDTDWQDVIFRTSVSHSQNVSYSKGFKAGSIRASVGYEDQQGILENSYMKRFTGRVNGAKSFMDDKLNLNLSATYSNVQREDPPISGNAGHQGDILGAAYAANPTWPNDPDFTATAGLRNPANLLEYYKSEGFTNRVLTNFSADYKITDGLVAKATYGIDWAKAERTTVNSGQTLNVGNNVPGQGLAQLNENSNINNLFEFTLNYRKKVGAVAIDLVGGYSVQSFRNQWSWVTGKGFTDPNNIGSIKDELRDSYDAVDGVIPGSLDQVHNWGFATDIRDGDTNVPGVSGFVNGVENDALTKTNIAAMPAGMTVGALTGNFFDQTDYLQSYFARGNFTISEKYIITATIRMDGSSKFGDDNKYGIFPSGAVAWKIHDEGFAPDLFSTLKFRAGYGVVGNQDGLGYGEFVRKDRWSDVAINDNVSVNRAGGTSATGTANPGLKWESTSQLAIGIDFGIFVEKLTGSFDYYNKQTTDLLLRYNVPQPASTSTFYGNLDAIVENKGWELALNYDVIETEDASFSIGGNISKNNNIIKDLANLIDAGQIYGPGLSQAYAQRLAEGQPLFSYHLRQFGGFDAQGQAIGGDVQSFSGKSALPTWNAGLSLNAGYKNFDFATYFTGQFGQYVYNNTANAFFTAGTLATGKNVTYDVVGNGEAGTAEASVSTRFLEKGDFIRMQNFTLGYNFDLEVDAISNLRLYVNGQNLFVITDYTGLDPEVSSNPANYQLLNGLPTAGIDYTSYPRPRVFTLGLNATF